MINQTMIGKFIAKKRREINLTQEQLGEVLGISHKSVSKWETGKCMPDYSIIGLLCETLEISMSELLDGQENEKEGIRVYDDKQMLDMIERVQRLEKQKQIISGIMLIVMGVALMSLSNSLDGTGFKSVVSGVIMGMSAGISLAGVYIAILSLSK